MRPLRNPAIETPTSAPSRGSPTGLPLHWFPCRRFPPGGPQQSVHSRQTPKGIFSRLSPPRIHIQRFASRGPVQRGFPSRVSNPWVPSRSFLQRLISRRTPPGFPYKRFPRRVPSKGISSRVSQGYLLTGPLQGVRLARMAQVVLYWISPPAGTFHGALPEDPLQAVSYSGFPLEGPLQGIQSWFL